MGLTGFNKFVREYGGEFEDEINLIIFNGYRIAIDGNWIAYRNLSVATTIVLGETNVLDDDPDHHKILSRFLQMVLNHVLTFLKMGITPIFVLDGPRIEAKTVTIDERVNKRLAAFEKIREIREEIKTGDSVDLQFCKDELEKMFAKTISFDDFMKDGVKNLMYSLGIPFFQSKHDGEKLCSSFCIETEVAAVYSSDADNYAFGCPRLITKITKTIHLGDGDIVSYGILTKNKKVRKLLGITPSQLTDIFIMSGCDYNGDGLWRIGAKTAYNLIRGCERIECLPEKYDVTSLEVETCRDIFQYTKSSDYILESSSSFELNIETLEDTGREILEQYELLYMYEEIYILFTNVPKSKRGVPPELREC